MENKLIENQDLLAEEIRIQQKINQYIDSKKHFLFESGAGAGKTYALKESVKHVLQIYGCKLRQSNQKVLCITFTNTAKNEIMKETDYNPWVSILTIHEFLWSIIRRHQNLLINEHARYIKFKLKEYNKILTDLDTPIVKILNSLDISLEDFQKEIQLEKVKEVHHKHYNDKAKIYRNAMQSVIELDVSQEALKNVKNFKSYLSTFYKYERLALTKKKMIESKGNGIKIEYNHISGRDILNEYSIGHDTVLIYANRIIHEYDMIKKIIIEKFPFIFVDEYQDTSEEVIDTLRDLAAYADNRNLNFIIGLFGDSAQKIYRKGIGDKIITNLSDYRNLTVIYKEINRRSSSKIIDVGNRIRNDEIQQKSIYLEPDFGTVKFVIFSQDDELIEKINDILQYQISKRFFPKTIQNICIMARHRDLAKLGGFKRLYFNVSKLPKYSGHNYDRLNEEFLSRDSQHLNPFFRSLSEFCSLFETISSNKLLKELIVYEDSLKHMTYRDLNKLLNTLKQIFNFMENRSLLEVIEFIDNQVEKNIYLSKILYSIFTLEPFSRESFEYFANVSLSEKFSLTDEKYDLEKKIINDIIHIPMREVFSWHRYRNRVYLPTEMNYSTMHDTKGSEFENVFIVLNDEFSRSTKYFSNYFSNYSNERSDKLKDVRNLLYVSCTRARANLFVFIPRKMYENNSRSFLEIFHFSDETES